MWVTSIEKLFCSLNLQSIGFRLRDSNLFNLERCFHSDHCDDTNVTPNFCSIGQKQFFGWKDEDEVTVATQRRFLIGEKLWSDQRLATQAKVNSRKLHPMTSQLGRRAVHEACDVTSWNLLSLVIYLISCTPQLNALIDYSWLKCPIFVDHHLIWVIWNGVAAITTTTTRKAKNLVERENNSFYFGLRSFCSKLVAMFWMMKNAEDDAIGSNFTFGSNGGGGGSSSNLEAKRRLEMDKPGSSEAPQEPSSSGWSCSCSGKFHVSGSPGNGTTSSPLCSML